jgi:hypothetical protein
MSTKEVLISQGYNCIDDGYDRATLFPGWIKGDGCALFKLENNAIKEMYTGHPDKEWHPIDITKVNYELILFMLQYAKPEEYPHTKEVLEYALHNDYIDQRYYDLWVNQ